MVPPGSDPQPDKHLAERPRSPDGIDQLIVLNGAQGLSEVLAQALSHGVTGLRLARNLLSGEADGGNGDAKAAAASASEPAPASQ